MEVNGRSVVDPQSFQFVDSSPVKPLGLVNSIHTGMEEAAGIIFFVLIIGGTFGILTTTGAIEALIVTLSRKLKNQEKWLIPIMMFFFAMGGSLMGMAEETIPYIAVMIPLAVALGFDVITGAVIVLVGASVGFTSAIMNPFTVGVAQGIAELPTFSGAGFRIGVFAVMYLVSVGFVYRYAMKVKRDRSLGFFGGFEGTNADELLRSDVVLTTRHKWILICFLINFLVLAFQFGDGISNIFIPTSGYFMAGLALAGIPWSRWMKWILPLIVAQYAIAVVAVVVAQLIGYGPF
ncbi:hypothetical protein ACT91Q_13755 [Brevibacillus thermoruber]|uniref:hypothetical protein n=1 Tax=Brevibacillus thermoruber TaxID=33942 RepID=UPI0040418A92